MGNASPDAIRFNVAALGHSTYTYKVFRPIQVFDKLIRAISSIEGVRYEVVRASEDAVLVEFSPDYDTEDTHTQVIKTIADHIGLSDEDMERLTLSVHKATRHVIDIAFTHYSRFSSAGML